MQEERVLTIVVTHHLIEDTWVAEVQELQGCVAFGHSEEDLRAKLPIAIADYMELFHGADHVEIGEPVELPDLGSADNVARSEVKVLANAC